MAYIERDNLEALLTKLNNTCEENDLVYKFESGRYPVRILIGPDQSMEAQMSMLDQDVTPPSTMCSCSPERTPPSALYLLMAS